MNDHRLTRGQPAPSEQGQIGAMEGKQEGSGLGIVELWRGIENRDGRSDGVLGNPAEGIVGDGHHPLAQPAFGAVTGRIDHAADVHAQCERGWGGDRDEPSAAAVDVVEVEGGSTYLHPHLAGPGLGTLEFPHSEDLPGEPWLVT